MSRRLVRAAGLAGVVASLAYAAGDVLMLGRRAEPERHPGLMAVEGVGKQALWMVPSSTGRLTAGALAGVYATPLYLPALWHLYRGLAPAGRRVALPPALVLAGAWTLAPFIHGSYLHTGQAYKDLEELADDPRARERLLATAKAFERATIAAYLPYGLAVLVSSGMIAAAIRSGRTDYPRWSWALVAPLPPIAAATAVTASHVLPGPARHALQGTGISLGTAISFAASTVLLWRRRR